MSYNKLVRKIAEDLVGKRTSNFVRHRPDEYEKLKTATGFLPSDATCPQRVWQVINNLDHIPPCSVCGSPLKWISGYKGGSRYTDFCSVKCAQQDPSVRQKKANTCLSKYGVESFSQTDSFKKRMTQVDRSQQKPRVVSDEDKAKSLESRRRTNLERYGATNYLTTLPNPRYTATEEFREKSVATMLAKYGVDHNSKLPETLEKRKLTCLEKYGDSSWSRSHIDVDVMVKLNSPEWLQEQIRLKRPSTAIAKELGVDKETVGNYYKKFGLTRKRFFVSQPEREITEYIQSLGVEAMNNVRTIPGVTEVDIFIPSHNIAIEYHGLFWHCDYHELNTRSRHRDKMLACNAQGIRLIQIFEDEWIHNKEIVLSKLANLLGSDKSPVVGARKCEVRQISKTEKKEFFDRYHIQGDGPSTTNYALVHNGQIIAAMGVLLQQGKAVVNRYATSCRVPGGFTKILKQVRKDVGPIDIVTFADRRWSDGSLYQQAGFVLDSEVDPDYYYVNLSKQTRHHKFAFRRNRLKNLLPSFDPDLSEVENMRQHGYYRVWNAGLLRFISCD